MVSRSTSAPKSLDDVAPIVTGNFTLGRLGKVSRSRTSQSFSSLATSWETREDPFSLVGFFPSRLSESQVGWDWLYLRNNMESKDEDDASAHDNFSAFSRPGGRKQSSYDDFAGQVIDGEDKYGMLAFSSENLQSMLQSKMPMFERPVHVSAPVVEEPLDLDALYSKHCSRRETVTEGEAEQSHEIGQLFFSSEEETMETGLSWTKTPLARLLSLVGEL
ncbi:hypothetical protein JB92DRAFT_3117781 [Gautieria morchelliformis]|nr:hypothetical protein JB92DRAFT_3117781 [Gautieria morchelliformis]